MAEHSSTPWVAKRRDSRTFKVISTTGELVISSYALTEANAEYIVRCVNAHEALVEACRLAHSAIERTLPYVYSEEDYVAKAERALREALKLAEGQETTHASHS